MTRTSHTAHATPAFPVYCVDWADDDVVVLGGGGGASRSGIENKIKLCKVAKDGRKIKYLAETKLSNEEDAPMTIAVDRKTKSIYTGVNASSSSIQSGKNDHCRVYSYSDDKVEYQKGQSTITATWSDDYPYQKLTSVSPNGKLLALGTTDDVVNILHLPTLESAGPSISLDAELVDLDWGGEGEWLSVATTNALQLYKIEHGEKLAVNLKQTLYPPSLDIAAVSYRAARFSPKSESTTPMLHAVLNATKVPKRGAPRKSFVVTFGVVAGPSKTQVTPAESQSEKGKQKAQDTDLGDELGRWDVIVRREVAGKPVTVFDVSSDGKLLSYGCADLSIGILDAKTLAPLLKILHAHSFPPTALKFNPSATLLVSASADNTIRAIVVPASFEGLSASMIAVFVAILVILLAVLLRR